MVSAASTFSSRSSRGCAFNRSKVSLASSSSRRSCRSRHRGGGLLEPFDPWRRREVLEDLTRLEQEGLRVRSLSPMSEPLTVFEQRLRHREREPQLAERSDRSLEPSLDLVRLTVQRGETTPESQRLRMEERGL